MGRTMDVGTDEEVGSSSSESEESGNNSEESEEQEEEKVDQSDLISAINDSQVDTVQELLERGRSSGIYLNRKSTPKDETPLMLAVKTGSKRLVDIVLGFGPFLNEKDHEGRTALHIAAWHGYGPISKALLKAGANPRAKDTGIKNTPLIFAARQGHRVVVQELMKKGANTKDMDKWDYTALHYAARNGHLSVVKELVDEWGAKVGAKTDTGHSPRALARNKGHTSVVNFLSKKM